MIYPLTFTGEQLASDPKQNIFRHCHEMCLNWTTLFTKFISDQVHIGLSEAECKVTNH